MSYFRKSILLFVFMFGVFSAPYASAAFCTNVEAHTAAFIADCKGMPSSNGYATNYANQATCTWTKSDSVTKTNTCEKWNGSRLSNFQGGGYCPEGANGSPCACTKGINWSKDAQRCKN